MPTITGYELNGRHCCQAHKTGNVERVFFIAIAVPLRFQTEVHSDAETVEVANQTEPEVFQDCLIDIIGHIKFPMKPLVDISRKSNGQVE